MSLNLITAEKKIELTSDHFDSKSNYDMIINYIYEDLAPVYACRLKKIQKNCSKIIDLTNENTKQKITNSMNILSRPEKEIISQRNNGTIRKDLAERLGISIYTVERLEWKARIKLKRLNMIKPPVT